MQQSDKTKYERVRDRDRTEAQQDVRRREADAIRERREVMFGNRADDDSDGAINDAAGMAFSGGGVRSASFNLGLLQAFTQSGMMRWIDYLSTVSGGGFIGTYFSTLLCHTQTKKLNSELPFVPKKGGGAPVPVDHFIRGGSYLKDSAMMLDRFVMGFVLNVILWGSLLVFVTSSLALVWRMLDSPALNVFVRDHFPRAGKYFTDWSRPFLFTFLFLIIWLGTWIWTYSKGFGPRYDAPRRMQKKVLIVALLCGVVGIASLLATEDISLTGLEPLVGSDHYEPYARGNNIVGMLLLGTLLLNILPYLNPVAIFRSEMRPPGKVQNSILKFSGGALLLLLPFSMVYLFSLEGISNYHTRRDSNFVAVDIRRPFELLHRLREQAHAAPEMKLGTPANVGPITPPVSPVPRERFGAPKIAGIIYTDTLAKGLPAETDEVAPSTYLMSQKIIEGSKEGTRNVLHGYDYIFERVHHCTIIEAFEKAPKFKEELEIFWDERKVLAGILRETDESDNSNRKGRIRGELHWLALKRQCDADLDEMTGDPELDSFIEFGKALETQYQQSAKEGDGFNKTTISNSTIDFARKVTGAYIATVLNNKFLGSSAAIKTLLEQSQDKPDVTLYDSTHSFFQRASMLREGDAFVNEVWPRAVVLQGVLVEKDRKKVNRWIMETLYSSFYVEERTKVGLALCWGDDQWRRFHFAAASLGVFLLFGLTIDINATSLHGFYRKKLEDAYVVQGTDGEKLCDLNTTAKGGPYHFICTTLNLFDDWPWKTTEYSSAYTFYFSRLYCGSQALPGDPRKTNKYCGGNLDVATVAAISGAAFSPAILKNPLLFCMTMLLNLRLGQWLPNPAKEIATRSSRRVTMISILRDFFITLIAEKDAKRPDRWNYCFLSDGGHNDNLALAPLLFRRPRLVFVSDATQDGDYNFPDFFKAHRRYRVRGSMNFRKLNCWDDLREDAKCVDLSPLKPRQITCSEETVRSKGEDSTPDGRTSNRDLRLESQVPARSPRHFVLSKFTYPTKQCDPTILVFIKTTMTGDEPEDLRQYQVDHPEFPHDPTSDQFFTENQVESYRELGEHIGKDVCDTVERGRKLLGLQRETDGLWADDCPHQVEDITWMLLLGYFDGELPVNDPTTLLQLLRRCLSVDLMVELFAALAPHNLEEQRDSGLDQIVRSKVAVLKEEAIQDLLGRLVIESEQAAKDLGLGNPAAAKRLSALERILLELKKALAQREKTSVGGGREYFVRSSAAEQAVESTYRNAVSETFGHLEKLPDEVLDFLLRVIKKAQGTTCLDLFAKLVWSRLDSSRADQFVSAMCARLSKIPSPDDAKRALAYLQEAAIREGKDRPAKGARHANAQEWRLIDYALHRIAADSSFPVGVSKYARQLLQDELQHAQQVVDGVESVETDDNLQPIINEFFEILAGDIERPQESVILYSLGVAERRLRKLLGGVVVKVAFVSRELGGDEEPVSDDESLRYTFFQPDAVVTTTDKTLARRVFQKAVPDYVPNIADANDLKEPPRTTKGMVAAISCFIDGEQDTPEGVLNVSSKSSLNGPQLKKLKVEMGKLARLCAYASQIGKLREATESPST